MKYKKVVRERIVDANGRVISEATSQVISENSDRQKTHQSVSATVNKYASRGSSSSSSSSSSSHSQS